jgi:hypothetical protein
VRLVRLGGGGDAAAGERRQKRGAALNVLVGLREGLVAIASEIFAACE